MFSAEEHKRDWRAFMEVVDEYGEEQLPCRQAPDFFFTSSRDKHANGDMRMAKKLCSGCGIRTECLIYALKHENDHGVWGGTSVNERHQIKRGGYRA